MLPEDEIRNAPTETPEQETESAVSEAEHSSYLDGLNRELESVKDAESKLQKVISFMEEALAQKGRPHFKSFWQARTLCLEFFKDDSIPPAVRTTLWTKYTELSKTARRLKDFFDEQSAFAVEQIEIAINALEAEMKDFDPKVASEPALEITSQTIEKHQKLYTTLQNEISFYNTKAARINALRKELINTGMPSRKKNKFFQRLSSLGDSIFPNRKELIQKLSQQFMDDVDGFIKAHFSKEMHGPLFFLREEIKSLQGMAKQLTLNTNAFTQTRLRLSECWDKIKVLDKERKKERMQQQSAFKQNEDTVKAKIEECRTYLQEQKPSANEGLKKIDEVSVFMRSLQLGRHEVKTLKHDLDALKQPLLDQIKTESQRRHEQEIEKQNQKNQQVNEIKQAIDSLLHHSANKSLENINAEKAALQERINSGTFSRTEKLEFDRLLKPLRDLLLEKKASALKNLSDNDRQALGQLKELLEERKELRNEVKEQLESLRRSVGSSGLDFEKALEYNVQISEQKERLEKINHGIEEVEDRISKIEG